MKELGYNYANICNHFYSYLHDMMDETPELRISINKFRKVIDREEFWPVDIVEKHKFCKTKKELYDYLEKLVFDYLEIYKDKKYLQPKIYTFKRFNEAMLADDTGNISFNEIDCLTAYAEDDIHSAYEKGIEAREKGYDIDENPYVDEADKELWYAWKEGWDYSNR